MARAARIALDLTLASINVVRPVITKLWFAAKTKLSDTKAKILVNNDVVTKMELSLDHLTKSLVSSLTNLRNRQLPAEQRYLEQELDKVKRKLGGGGGGGIGGASQTVKTHAKVAWQYMKVECAPPTTIGILNGAVGKKLENAVSSAANGFIGAIQKQIQEIDAAEIRKIKEKEAATKAAQEKAVAEELKKKEEALKQALIAKIAKEKVAAEKTKKAKAEAVPAKEKKDEKTEKKQPPKARKDTKNLPKKEETKSPKKT